MFIDQWLMSIGLWLYKIFQRSIYRKHSTSLHKPLRNRNFFSSRRQLFDSSMSMGVSVRPAHEFISFLNASPTRRLVGALFDID